MKNYLLIALLFIGFEISLFSQSSVPGFVKDSLNTYINRALHEWNIPGVAVAVVKDGNLVVARGYGRQSIVGDDKVDENTLFMIGSNTKAFTGTILALLQYEEKCSLNDKIIKWLPDFTMKDPWVARELNLNDVLSHRIGMETFQGDFMYWTSALTRKEVLQKFGGLTPIYGFRSKWGYTNAGFLIAGECIQKISGQSWESIIRSRIFDPLQMNRTRALAAEMPLQQNIAAPHTLVFDTLKLLPYPVMDNLAPAGSVCSSVSDMSHWLICQLDSGRFNGKSVIPFSVIRETRQPRSVIGSSSSPFNRSHFSLYGLGWDLTDYEGREIVSHTGGVNGFVTSVTFLPEENLGIVVLTNTDENYFYEALKWEILDSYLNLPYRNYSQLYNKYFKLSSERKISVYKAQKDSVAMYLKPSISLKNFTGHYLHPVYGYLDITQADNRLKMTFEHHPNLVGNLEYLSGERFLCTYSDPVYGIKVLTFKIDNGKVKSVIVRVNDFIEFLPYEFVKQS
ncbi:MAG: serine hydrolase [Bacteroidales bacterium]|jgi:CubicO group peptidase (beta-lactamase class C family)|nr:serine hydrolase [Bacteroidales bacterium]